ncbi:DUF348 domain-containing protein [Heliobacterium chlorum]|uniref:DUF348 domain-containing protein n=1 Tax=Heliobacterium chlorum TaxID=2698 RepID=A0ABR7T3C6_HELCL|nr:3D domain-containing protein [Heliobacterium chlorum]MBC9784166.1 DUF348 domain-containing protein [Heliobacterium chlorum]
MPDDTTTNPTEPLSFLQRLQTVAKDLTQFRSQPPGRQWKLALGLLVGLLFVTWGLYDWLQKDITLDIDGQKVVVGTFSHSVAEVLKEKEITLAEKDKVEPSPETALTDGLTVHIIRAFPVSLVVDGQRKEIVTTPVFVKDLVEQTSIKLQPKDRVEPSLETLVDKPGQVRIVRVQETEVVENEPIPFRTESKPDNSLEKGLQKIVSRGKNGIVRQATKVIFEDGQEVKRELISQEIVQPPVNQVVAMGTIDQVSRGGLRFRIKEALYMTATAYTHTGRNTASGAYPEVGMVAVDPSTIPMGSKLYVEGYGFARAADRGASIIGDHIDVFVETEQDARRWGKKNTKVYVLDE